MPMPSFSFFPRVSNGSTAVSFGSESFSITLRKLLQRPLTLVREFTEDVDLFRLNRE